MVRNNVDLVGEIPTIRKPNKPIFNGTLKKLS